MIKRMSVILGTGMMVWAQAPSGTGTQGQPTFAKDVAPIIQRSCQGCHRPGSIGPMSLLTYQDARPWARAIKQQVVQRNMPPGYIDRTVGIHQFKNDVSLSDQEIATISAWADNGALRATPLTCRPHGYSTTAIAGTSASLTWWLR